MTTLPLSAERALRKRHQRRTVSLPVHVRELPPGSTPGSDRRLREEIQHSLNATGYLALRHVTVHVSAGRAQLTGKVSSYYLKQVATTAAFAIRGVTTLRNELHVSVTHGGHTSGQTASETVQSQI
ncbi:BON domain-containing protein [bacterium]|nr:BON domain-containing protein [bacterium]